MKNSQPFTLIRNPVMALALAFFCVACAGGSHAVYAQGSMDQDETSRTDGASVVVARRLASRDPLERQRAAEELARTGAMEQQRMVEGYRAQEKNARVHLALDWALYRMGRTDMLFEIVRQLDSSRRNQAASYLTQLEGPEPLYIFLDHVNDEIMIHLIEALASLGNAETAKRLETYASSYDPRIANATQFALREIARRASAPSDQATRPRQTGVTEKTEEEAPTEQTEGEAPEETP
jgi:hypothetical protein